METEKPEENLSGVSSDANVPAVDAENQLAFVTGERDQLLTEKADLQDRLLRARAEFDNARRRAERERSEYLQFASMDLVRDLLPILDDEIQSDRAVGALRDYSLINRQGDGLRVHRLVQWIVQESLQRMAETLKKMGLEPIETAGRRFDPNLHQAVERVHTDDAADQTVLSEFQRGYNFRGKLLRPAMVKVAVKP